MKRTKITGLILALGAIALWLSACSDLLNRNEGTFSITIGSAGGRAALDPEYIARLTHIIKVHGGPGPDQSQTILPGGRTASFSVNSGRWTISAEAYLELGGDLMAEGSTTVEIKSGQNGAISIRMTWLGGEDGYQLDGMVLVPGGSFQMGQSGDGTSGNVTPVHTVTLSGFYIGKTEVTQEQYEAVMGTNPSNFSGANLPVENVSWYDALVFCNKLSIAEGLTPAYLISGSTDPSAWGSVPTSNNVTWNAVTIVAGSNGYRLPTEAQWEYAAKGGPLASNPPKIYSGSDDADTVAWHSGNSGSKTNEVGEKAANELGIHDMSGNVWELCWDWYETYPSTPQTDPQGPSSGSERVARGGGWNYFPAENSRSAGRGHDEPGYKNFDLGFRIVRPSGGYTITPSTFNVTSTEEWNDALSEISGKAGNYTITISGNVEVPGWQNVVTFGGRQDGSPLTVTLNGSGTLSLSSAGSLLLIGENQSLIMDGSLTIKGLETNSYPLFDISGGGTFTMKSGKISGNKNSFQTGGGVFINGSTFVMEDGEISDNKSSNGGGVNVNNDGIFIMNGGKISDNKGITGGGVIVFGTFTMTGGKISGNTADISGGGVNVGGGTFDMTGGTISGNTAGYGGGVGVDQGSTFRISNGIVYGLDADGGLKNTASDNNNAAAFYTDGGTAEYGTFNGATWTKKGDLTTTDNTIRVVEGIPSVATAAEWNTAVSAITGGASGNPKAHTINITGDFSIDGTASNTFTSSYIDITLKGNGNTISLNSNSTGSLLRIGANQTVTMDGLTLKGHGSNNTELVYIGANGSFMMSSGEISGNTNGGGGVSVTGVFTMNGGKISDNEGLTGGGVAVASSGTFTMNGGTISGNNGRLGGGVYVYGTFTMNDGTISGNNAPGDDGKGGGVLVRSGGTFLLITGTIYGLDADDGLKNTADEGAALYIYDAATATYGLNGAGTDLTTTDDTIRVVNGELVQE